MARIDSAQGLDLTIELFGHMDAGDRRLWSGDQNLRPLSELGCAQAARMDEALGVRRCDALFSSPALRCRESVARLATRFGLEVIVLGELAEEADSPPVWPAAWSGWDANWQDKFRGAYLAGRASGAIERIRGAIGVGRVVVCSHGDIVPTLAVLLAGAHGLKPPAAPSRRGEWYTLHFSPTGVTIDHNPMPHDFPA